MRSFSEGRRASWLERAASRRPDPILMVELLQTAKAALAGVVAWVIATDVLHLQQAFLAPWSAVLVVHATVYRTMSRGGKQIAATFAGVFLAWGCGELLGVGAAGMGVTLLAAFALGRNRWLREESTTIATTGIVVLATGAINESNLLAGRLIDTSVGVLVGLLINLLVWPPLGDRAAWARGAELPQELADVLAKMAVDTTPDLEPAAAEEWVGDLRRIDERLDEAWQLLGQARESTRMNPRRSQPAGLDDLVRILRLLEQSVADSMSMARTIATSAQNETLWEKEFRDPWKKLLQQTAEGARDQDEERLREVRAQLNLFANDLSTDSLPGSAWHEYGGLLVNLRNVVDALLELTVWGKGSAFSPPRVKRQRPRLRRRRGGSGASSEGPAGS